MELKPLVKRTEVWNGREVVVYRPNPKYPREKALREFVKMMKRVARRIPS